MCKKKKNKPQSTTMSKIVKFGVLAFSMLTFAGFSQQAHADVPGIRVSDEIYRPFGNNVDPTTRILRDFGREQKYYKGSVGSAWAGPYVYMASKSQGEKDKELMQFKAPERTPQVYNISAYGEHYNYRIYYEDATRGRSGKKLRFKFTLENKYGTNRGGNARVSLMNDRGEVITKEMFISNSQSQEIVMPDESFKHLLVEGEFNITPDLSQKIATNFQPYFAEDSYYPSYSKLLMYNSDVTEVSGSGELDDDPDPIFYMNYPHLQFGEIRVGGQEQMQQVDKFVQVEGNFKRKSWKLQGRILNHANDGINLAVDISGNGNKVTLNGSNQNLIKRDDLYSNDYARFYVKANPGAAGGSFTKNIEWTLAPAVWEDKVATGSSSASSSSSSSSGDAEGWDFGSSSGYDGSQDFRPWGYQ